MKDTIIKPTTQSILKELSGNNKHKNILCIGGVTLSSTNCTLAQLERTANRLIKKHRNYLLLKTQLDIATGQGVVDSGED